MELETHENIIIEFMSSFRMENIKVTEIEDQQIDFSVIRRLFKAKYLTKIQNPIFDQ